MHVDVMKQYIEYNFVLLSINSCINVVRSLISTICMYVCIYTYARIRSLYVSPCVCLRVTDGAI